MGTVPQFLGKEVPDLSVLTKVPSKSFTETEFNNFDPSGIFAPGFDLINTIIGHATGTTAATIEAQKQQAAALQAQAEAERAKAEKKSNTVAVVAVGGVALLAITGTIMYFKYRKKKAA